MTRSMVNGLTVTSRSARTLVDVGAGSSTLVDELLAAGRLEVTVLDVSQAAFPMTQRRVGDEADRVTSEVADITGWQPTRTYQV